MSGYEGDEPWNNVVEIARIWKFGHVFPIVTLRYDSSSGLSLLMVSFFSRFQIYLDLSWILSGFDAQNGSITSIQRDNQTGCTTLEVVSNGGHEFVVKRRRGGGRYG